jgi:amino acid permease
MLEEMTVLDAALLMVVRFIAIFLILIILMLCLYLFGYLSHRISERQRRASGTEASSGSQ